MLSWRHIVLFLCITLTHTGVWGQSLRSLTNNPVIQSHRASASFLNIKKTATEKDFVNALPFFEDFSTSDIYPDPTKWTDSMAFINTSLPVDPISVGVATLDAIDAEGTVYATDDNPVSSDELTSWPFNLAPYASSGDEVVLSFFYQAGGYGEVPELNDSLLLELFNPADDQWYTVWHAIEDTLTDFEQVIYTIPASYYQDGFRFRFRNYTSMSANDVIGGEGALSNVDFWNIDYILLNTEPVTAHQSIDDIALVDPPLYLLDFYEIVPWSHLNSAQGITRNMLHYVIRNIEAAGDTVNVGRSYYVKDLQTGSTEYAEQSYAKFAPNTLERKDDPFYAPFTNSGDEEEGSFEVGAYLITPTAQYKYNDTAKTYLHFKDYYAYDDGIPEYGFGITGESAYEAFLAYRFRIYKSDTLSAIDIFFNETRNDYTADETFQLCVWDDNNGEPGTLLFISSEEYGPEHGDFLEPVRYALNSDSKLVIEDSIVYVGFKQLTNEFLNIGYDVNKDSKEKIFLNVSGSWFNPGTSLTSGSLMIRPVFGETSTATGPGEHYNDNQCPTAYPNPVADILYIETGDYIPEQIILYDGFGRAVFSSNDSSLNHISVSGFPSGLYYLSILDTKGNLTYQKIVIRH